MVKWNAIYTRIAARNGVSSDYVKQIHLGIRESNSSKAKTIKAALTKAEGKVKLFEKSVA